MALMICRGLATPALVLFAATFAFAQGKCNDGYETPSCPLSVQVATAPINPVFAPTGWKTVALDHITFEMPDYRKEAAFYVSLMGWKLRSDDGKQAILDIGDWGSVIFQEAPERQSAVVKSFCFVIEPWDAKTVEAELRKRGLNPVAENDGNLFESFHVKDPDGWDLQISNGSGLVKSRNAQRVLGLPRQLHSRLPDGRRYGSIISRFGSRTTKRALRFTATCWDGNQPTMKEASRS